MNLSQSAVIVPVLALVGAPGAMILVLEVWLDPELRIPLPRPRHSRSHWPFIAATPSAAVPETSPRSLA